MTTHSESPRGNPPGTIKGTTPMMQQHHVLQVLLCLRFSWTCWSIIKSMLSASVKTFRLEATVAHLEWRYSGVDNNMSDWFSTFWKDTRRFMAFALASLRGTHPYIFLFHWCPPEDWLDGARGQCLLAGGFPWQPNLDPFPRHSGGDWSCLDEDLPVFKLVYSLFII